VSWIEASQILPRRGIATALYEAAARESCKVFEQPLRSDTRRRDGAQEFWDKQVAKGRARFLPEAGQFELTCPAPASLAGLRRRKR
jgi:hypothetical protein